MTHQNDTPKEPHDNPEVDPSLDDSETGTNMAGDAIQEPQALSLEDQLTQTKDQLLRALAECENIRKRSLKEREEVAQYAITKFARDLLGIADNLSRAIEAAEKDTDIKVVLEGIHITQKELQKVFEKHGIKMLSPKGETFDHNLHQAMFEIESEDHPEGHVMEVMQHGYVLQDRLLRPALVGVSKGKKS